VFLACEFGDEQTSKEVAYVPASAVAQLVAVVFVERKAEAR
jgi:hypothetical protein